jgi:hypothetical protein
MIALYQIKKPSQCRKESRIYGLSWGKKNITKHSFREISSILKQNFRSSYPPGARTREPRHWTVSDQTILGQ